MKHIHIIFKIIVYNFQIWKSTDAKRRLPRQELDTAHQNDDMNLIFTKELNPKNSFSKFVLFRNEKRYSMLTALTKPN